MTLSDLLAAIRAARLASFQMADPRLVLGTEEADLLIASGIVTDLDAQTVDGLHIRIDETAGVRVEDEA